VEQLIQEHNASICIVCGISENLTKEHVIPKLAFGNDEKKYFVTNINGIGQSYSKTVLPAGAHCNSYILGALERHHKVNEFIFIELPKQKVALFYFINRSFDDEREAYDLAMEKIKAVY